MQSRAPTLAPSDSVSNIDPDFPLGPEQPADRPEKYPEAILWNLTDAQKDLTVYPGNTTNTSRPPMEKALRNEDGSLVTRASWEIIKLSAKSAIGTYLRKLDAEATKKHFRAHHTREWNNAIAFLEKARPLVGLCAGHWKAEHVLSTVLASERSSMKRAEKKTQKKAQPVSSEGEDFGNNIPDDGDDDDNDGDNVDLNVKKRPAPRSKEDPTKVKKVKARHESKPAARVKAVPTNTKPKMQQQLKTPAVEKGAQRLAQLAKKAQGKPSNSIYIYIDV